MTLESIEFFVSLADVENFDLLITTAGQEPVAINGVPPNLVNGRVMGMLFIDISPTLSRIPNLDVGVLTTSQDKRLSGMPVTRLDV